MTPWLTIVGIGEDGLEGLSPIAKGYVERAEILIGGDRHLAMIPKDGTTRLSWGSPIQETIDKVVARRGSPTVILATGDPMWYGIGATLSSRVPSSEIKIVPSPSAFSLVAARMAWPIPEVECLTVHGRAVDRVRVFLAPDARLIILSANGGSPSAIAKLLVDAGFGDSEISVFSHMEGEREAVVRATAHEWSDPVVPDLNTIAVHCQASVDARPLSRISGLPDDAFEHDGQLTKREIRAATLAALCPMPRQHLWDVGAGCGSIAIEWMRAHIRNRATAIERHSARRSLIENNALTLGVPDLNIVEGEASELLDQLAPPDAVFLGGGVTEPELIERCWSCLGPGGRLVANAVTFEGESRLFAAAEMTGGELVKFEISRAAEIGRFHAWEPMKPVTQLRAVKS